MSIIPDTVNLLQVINGSVSEIVDCPSLEDYPATIDTARCPVALTECEGGSFGGFGNDETTLNYVIRVYYDTFGQGKFGDVQNRVHCLMDDFITKYITESTYEVLGSKVLQKEPIRLSIVNGLEGFQLGPYTALEYPQGSERWFHGFELRFAVQSATWSC